MQEKIKRKIEKEDDLYVGSMDSMPKFLTYVFEDVLKGVHEGINSKRNWNQLEPFHYTTQIHM